MPARYPVCAGGPRHTKTFTESPDDACQRLLSHAGGTPEGFASKPAGRALAWVEHVHCTITSKLNLNPKSRFLVVKFSLKNELY
jgi:hypothetical protein